MVNWDTVVSILVLLLIGIWFAARISGNTVPELFRSIQDIINGTREGALEKGEELMYYD